MICSLKLERNEWKLCGKDRPLRHAVWLRMASASASGQHAPGAVLATGAWAQCAGCSKRKQ
eukprot:4875994-Pleurochrysis_carterae.AAC.1